jgi:hypothetical protein
VYVAFFNVSLASLLILRVDNIISLSSRCCLSFACSIQLYMRLAMSSVSISRVRDFLVALIAVVYVVES